MNMQEIERLAAVVMYEGYLLYPYRLSVESQVLIEGQARACVQARVRFLQVQERAVSGAGQPLWQEGIEREVSLAPLPVATLVDRAERRTFRIASGHQREAQFDAGGRIVGEVVRQTEELSGEVELSAVPLREWTERALAWLGSSFGVSIVSQRVQ